MQVDGAADYLAIRKANDVCHPNRGLDDRARLAEHKQGRPGV
jgi:hypothetical protein